MILAEILELIATDIALSVMPIYPISTTEIKNCLIYTFTPITNDGITREDNFKVNVKNFDYISALDISEQLKALVITPTDKALTNHIKICTQTGGGEMYNGETKLHTITIIFTLISDARKGLK